MTVKFMAKYSGRSRRESFFKFSGIMWLAIVAVVGLCGHLTMTMEGNRKLPSDFSAQDSKVRGLQQEVDELSRVQVLPKLSASWTKVFAAAKITNLKMEVETGDSNSQAQGVSTYTGPANHWSGTLVGSPLDVLSLAKYLQSEVPMYLYDYTVSDGRMALKFAVIGVK